MDEGRLDRADVALLQLLLRDSRASVAQLAEATNLSQRYIHDSIDAMVEEGIIRAFTCKPSLAAINARSILLFGRSRMSSLQQGIQKLGGNDSMAWIAHASGGRFYVALHIQKVGDRDPKVKDVERDAMMTHPTIADRVLVDEGRDRFPFNAFDHRVIRSLSRESRKDLEDVAVELDEPVGKVRAAFYRMVDANALDLSIDINPDAANNPLCIFHLEGLDPDRLEEIAVRLMERHTPSIIFFNYYSNQKILTLVMALTQDYEEMRDILHSIQEEEAIPYVEVNPILSSCNMDTWRDKMVVKKGAAVRQREKS
jgi:DNA-binding Lrp family transcriptional regulator